MHRLTTKHAEQLAYLVLLVVNLHQWHFSCLHLCQPQRRLHASVCNIDNVLNCALTLLMPGRCQGPGGQLHLPGDGREVQLDSKCRPWFACTRNKYIVLDILAPNLNYKYINTQCITSGHFTDIWPVVWHHHAAPPFMHHYLVSKSCSGMYSYASVAVYDNCICYLCAYYRIVANTHRVSFLQPLLYNGRAVCAMKAGDYEEAERDLQEAFSKDAKDPDTLANLITAGLHLGKNTARYVS